MKTPISELLSDPFEERCVVKLHRDVHVLGANIRFESNNEQLLDLVDLAYAGLPRHNLARIQPQLRIRLVLKPPKRARAIREPESLQMLSGAGLLVGATGSSNIVVICPREHGALVIVAPRMLRFPYHTRYELIEFAVFTLVARVLGLVALHGACVGRAGKGILLMGPSGAGKSTVTLQCMIDGLEILAEDSVYVTPDTLVATGVSNFLHVRADSLRWVTERRTLARIRRSPVIRRRSGVQKYEIDLRGGGHRIARRPLKIVAIVFLSAQRAQGRILLERLPRRNALQRLVREQAYAANQPPWASFVSAVERLPILELRRGHQPADSVAALRALIDAASS